MDGNEEKEITSESTIERVLADYYAKTVVKEKAEATPAFTKQLSKEAQVYGDDVV
jgi:hypothetical protein